MSRAIICKLFILKEKTTKLLETVSKNDPSPIQQQGKTTRVKFASAIKNT